MNHVRVTTITGQEVEIPIDEVHRVMKNIAPSSHTQHHETNEYYKHRAYENVCELALHHGIKDVQNTESEMKKMMHFAVRHDDYDMFGEIIEWFIADHTEKTGA